MTRESLPNSVPLGVHSVLGDLRALQEVAKASNIPVRFRCKIEVELEAGAPPAPKPSSEGTVRNLLVGFGRVLFAFFTGRPVAHSQRPSDQGMPD